MFTGGAVGEGGGMRERKLEERKRWWYQKGENLKMTRRACIHSPGSPIAASTCIHRLGSARSGK